MGYLWGWLSSFVPDGEQPPDKVINFRSSSPRLNLNLTRLPNDPYASLGIYGKSGNWLPPRARYTNRDLHKAVTSLERDYPGAVRYSDMLRTASKSRDIFVSRKGALPPGWSTHNFGMAVDIDVSGSRDRLIELGRLELRARRWKPLLDRLLSRYGLFCFRTDGKRKREEWHYYAFPGGVDMLTVRSKGRSRYAAGERMIQDAHGLFWESMDAYAVQRLLKVAGFDPGPIDGILGKKSSKAVLGFQKKWGLGRLKRRRQRVKPGAADLTTRRVLAIATARRDANED